MEKRQVLKAPVFGAALLLMITACSDPAQESSEPISRPVKLLTVGETESVRTLKFPGSVAAVEQSDMAFEVPGQIVEMPVSEGERVEADTILARLDPRDYEAQRARAQAEANAARTDFRRYKKAFESEAVTEQELDRAKRALEVAEAELKRANKAVEETVLRAPFAGRVARKLVEDYANVQAKQPVLILQSDRALEMRVNVPEADWVGEEPVDSAADIESMGNIHVVLSALPSQRIPARITAFASTADPVIRTFEVTVQFEPPEGVSISPGMTGHVAYRPPPEASDELAIPADSVVTSPDNTPFVWLFDSESGSVSKQPVNVGELTGSQVRVLSGLEVGDTIALSGVHTLREGDLVHAMKD